MNKKELIKNYKLEPHPEGGFYRQIYQSPIEVYPPYDSEKTRPSATIIYFMVGLNDTSCLHRLKSDEIFHFYDGLPLTIAVLDSSKLDQFYTIKLGRNFSKGEVMQAVIPGGYWFGMFIGEEDRNETVDFCLVDATVTPGFDFKDFEIGSRQALLDKFPKAISVINKLTN